MDRVQFHHHNPPVWTAQSEWNEERYTMAVDVPPASDILDLMAFGNKKIVINVGSTIVNNKDNYNRKIGRDLSRSRLKPQIYELRIVEYKDEKKLDLYFYCDIIGSEIIFQVAFGKDRAYFIKGR